MSSNDNNRITDQLAKKYACYVLITCDSPKDDGKMNVNMSYGGDPMLASYLIQGAQTIIDEQALESKSSY
jgi:hypothetical protein